MSSKTILLAEDDPMVADALRLELELEGFEVLLARDGEEALFLALNHDPNLVLLDVMMPKKRGWEVCREIRAQSQVPIVMLTARGEEIDKILGLELGADDYVTKPFSFRELLARIHANIRRAELSQQPENHRGQADIIKIGNLEVDTARRLVRKASVLVDLSVKEYDLLHVMLSAKGAVVPRQLLYDRVWGFDWVGDTRTLDVHIRRLRRKLEDDDARPQLIMTARGVGYRLVSPFEVEE